MQRTLFPLVLCFFFLLLGTSGQAQRYAYVDTEYILNNIPEYEKAQKKLDEIAQQWQKEIEQKYEAIDKLYRSLQAEEVLLTKEMKKKREQEIMEKEREARELQKQRFGKNGDLYKKRKELVEPIQDRIYTAIKDLAESRNYTIIFDTSNRSSVLYTDDKYDKSDDILKKLGIEPGAAQDKEKSSQEGDQ